MDILGPDWKVVIGSIYILFLDKKKSAKKDILHGGCQSTALLVLPSLHCFPCFFVGVSHSLTHTCVSDSDFLSFVLPSAPTSQERLYVCMKMCDNSNRSNPKVPLFPFFAHGQTNNSPLFFSLSFCLLTEYAPTPALTSPIHPSPSFSLHPSLPPLSLPPFLSLSYRTPFFSLSLLFILLPPFHPTLLSISTLTLNQIQHRS